jgi:hypothetical protein
MRNIIVPQFSQPAFGPTIRQLPKPWKPCAAEWTSLGLFSCFCNNDTRRHSRVFLNDKEIHQDDGVEWHNETIGPAFEWRGYVGFAGEKGHLLYYDNGKLNKTFELMYANTLLEINGAPHVFDSYEGKIHVKNCFNGTVTMEMPGDGIVLSACHYKGKIYAAQADGDTLSGLSCSDGTVIKAAACQCVVPFLDKLIYSSRNQIFELGRDEPIATFDCEKIMWMRVADAKLWIAGTNPDSLWCGNSRGEIILVGRCQEGNQTVGGSCFRTCFALDQFGVAGYFLRTVDGDQTQAIQLVWQ